MFETKNFPIAQGRHTSSARRHIVTCCRWTLAVGVLAFLLMPWTALAKSPSCISPNTNAQCTRDNQCCAGSVCAGVCRRGCKINKVFYENGAINPDNDCQRCQASVSRFGWTSLASGTACGDQADDECTNPNTCNGQGTCLDNHEPAATTCGDAEAACTNQDYCNGSGGCTDNGFKTSSVSCTGSANGGACDSDPGDHCSGTDGSCVDAFQSASHICRPETGANGNYLCVEALRCTGTTSTCPTRDIESYDPTRICRASTAPCDPEEYCAGAGNCAADVTLPAGATCGAAAACEFPYTCDASGNCNSNGNLSDSASCRAPENTCDLRDLCGDPFPAGDARNRTDFVDYPECGPDAKKADGTACTVGLPGTAGEFAGTCQAGACTILDGCRYNIDCPDGYVCSESNCVAASIDHGYGDQCVGKKVCNGKSPTAKIGTICTFPVDCRDATHQDADCVPSFKGDCGSNDRGQLACCVGMDGDGVGGAAGPGQKGRCQECCATDYNDVTVTGCGELECCDGKCTDIYQDPHNCLGCAYEYGTDCDNYISACQPASVRCIDDGERYGCVMQEQTSINCGDDEYCVPPTETFTNPSCGYCDVLRGATLATNGNTCLVDSECGGVSGSCHRTNALCVTPSGLTVECAYDPHPFATNTPPECGGSKCYQTCPFGGETITAVVNPDCLSLVGGLEDPPYQYCPVECEAFPDPPNVGDTCEDDTDCDGGTSCKTDCDLSSPFLSAFCFETPTCQY